MINLRRLKNRISAWWHPPQKWLSDAIPKSYCDKDELIRVVLFKIFRDFVDVERGIHSIYWKGMGFEYPDQVAGLEIEEKNRKIAKEMWKAWDWIAIGREESVKKLSILRAAEDYNSSHPLDKEIEDTDTKVLAKIVEWRPLLWT